MRERAIGAIITMWSMGERKFMDDFKTRMMLCGEKHDIL